MGDLFLETHRALSLAFESSSHCPQKLPTNLPFWEWTSLCYDVKLLNFKLLRSKDHSLLWREMFYKLTLLWYHGGGAEWRVGSCLEHFFLLFSLLKRVINEPMTENNIFETQYFLANSVQFSHSVVSDSLWPHEPQHTRSPGPLPVPGAYTSSCPLSRWCHPTISSSVIPFSSCLQSFPTSGSFQMSQLFASGGQSIGVSASTSVLPSNEHPGLISFRMDWLDLLAVQGTLKSLLQHHSSKASILRCSAFFTVQLSHPYMTTGKTIALTRWTFVDKVMSLLFNMLSRGNSGNSVRLHFFGLQNHCRWWLQPWN